MKELAERIFKSMSDEFEALKDTEHRAFVELDGWYDDGYSFGLHILQSENWKELVKMIVKMRGDKRIKTADEIYAFGQAFIIG